MKTLVFISMAIVLSGCSMEASIFSTDLPTLGNLFQEKPGGAEFISGATGADPGSPGAYVETVPQGYKVQAAVGHFLPKPVQTTTIRGYKVYSSVQGSMLSE